MLPILYSLYPFSFDYIIHLFETFLVHHIHKQRFPMVMSVIINCLNPLSTEKRLNHSFRRGTMPFKLMTIIKHFRSLFSNHTNEQLPTMQPRFKHVTSKFIRAIRYIMVTL